MTERQEAKLDEIGQKLAAMGGQLNAITNKLAEHDHTLYGNGQPGLKEKVTVLQESERANRRNTQLVLGIIGAVCAVVAIVTR